MNFIKLTQPDGQDRYVNAVSIDSIGPAGTGQSNSRSCLIIGGRDFYVREDVTTVLKLIADVPVDDTYTPLAEIAQYVRALVQRASDLAKVISQK
jgi:uncharacterized protein YlzI (FlbEa/FlbD family)